MNGLHRGRLQAKTVTLLALFQTVNLAASLSVVLSFNIDSYFDTIFLFLSLFYRLFIDPGATHAPMAPAENYCGIGF